MRIQVLGTRGEIEESAPYHSKKSGVLIDDKILLDCGGERFLQYNPEAVLITHLHPDHAYFVRHGEKPSSKMRWYAPESYEGGDLAVLSKTRVINGYRVTPVPTIHSLHVASQAYLIEHDHKKILYTGDLVWLEQKYQHLLNGCDLIITDGSFMRQGGMIRKDASTGRLYGHAGIPNLINLFKPFTNTILFVHFGAWFYRDIKESRLMFKKLARENNVNIIVGYDGLAVLLE